MGLEQAAEDDAGFGLAKRGADARSRSAAKGDECEGRRLARPGKALGAEALCILPMLGVAVGQIDRLEDALTGGNALGAELHFVLHHPVP